MANNEYVNKVQFGDTTIMDISDTTAESNDVIEGEVFYTKSGARSTGTLGDATQSTHGLMSTTDKIKLDGIDTMLGATSTTVGATGLVPMPTTADVNKFLAGDGTWKDGGMPMVILSYGNSTWQDFINAYNNHVIVYCRASSNSNPASGSQTRMAFMAYVNNASNPTNVEFQYYRSMSSHSATAMGDEVYVYKLTNSNGGTWTVTTRKTSIKEIAVASGSKLGVSWSSDKVTLSNTMTADDMPMSSSDSTTAKAAIEAKYTKPSGGIPATDLAETYITSHQDISGKADKAGTILDTTLSRGRLANSTVGTASFAFGNDVTASAVASHAEGQGTIASNMFSHAEGYQTTASGLASHAEGNDTTASSLYSHAEGYSTTASQQAAHAEGSSTIASELYSHAEGYHTTASNTAAHAEGTSTIASGDSSHAEGLRNNASITITSTTYATGATGNQSHSEGFNTAAIGQASHAEGLATAATGSQAHAEGYNTVASGQYSHAEGYGSLASSYNTHAEGSGTSATQSCAHAEGSNSIASNVAAHAEGNGTTASSANAHAEGYQTVASHVEAHAEGYRAVASGPMSHAEGSDSTASGPMSHAEGSDSIAYGSMSHAQNYYTIANGQSSTAAGKFNVPDSYDSWTEWVTETSYSVGDKVKVTTTSDNVTTVKGYVCKTANNSSTFTTSEWTAVPEMNYAEIIGNGTADDARSNARALDWDGNEYLQGNIYVGCNADSTGGTKLLPGTQPFTVTLDTVTNTSGSYTHTTQNSSITATMKPIQIECSNPDAFGDNITITTSAGEITLTCNEVTGTSDVTVTLMQQVAEAFRPLETTSTEFDILAGRIGTLSSLATTEQNTIVGAINEINEKTTFSSGSVTANGVTAYYYKWGRIVSIHISGSLSADKDANTTILTIPQGYRPNREYEFSAWNASWSNGHKPVYINASGLFCGKTALAAGGLYGSCTYICSE